MNLDINQWPWDWKGDEESESGILGISMVFKRFESK